MAAIARTLAVEEAIPVIIWRSAADNQSITLKIEALDAYASKPNRQIPPRAKRPIRLTVSGRGLTDDYQ